MCEKTAASANMSGSPCARILRSSLGPAGCWVVPAALAPGTELQCTLEVGGAKLVHGATGRLICRFGFVVPCCFCVARAVKFSAERFATYQ